MALWEGQDSDRPRLEGLSVSESKVLRIAVMQKGARCGYVTRTKRERDALKAAAPS